MKPFNIFSQAFKGIEQGDRPSQRATFMRGQPIKSTLNNADYEKFYKEWTYVAVNKINQNISNIQLVLKRRKKQSEFEEVDTHPVLDLLYKVNPIFTSNQLWEATSGYFELTGEAYWLLMGSAKNPKEIWPLRPDWLEIKDTRNSIIDSYAYGAPGDKKITIPFENIVPFKGWNPMNAYRGYGSMRASERPVNTDEAAGKYNENFFENSARPSGALSTTGALPDDARERIREEWERIHRGRDNSWKVALLEGGLTWQDVGINQKDMDYLEGRRFNRDEILAIYGVPKAIVAVTDDVNRANARESRAVFLENTIEPKHRNYASSLTEFLLPRYNDPDLFFDIISPVPADNEYALRKRDIDLKNGVITRNEAREEDDLGPIEGGDQLLVPFGLTPIGEAGQKTQDATQLAKRSRTVVRVPQYSHTRKTWDNIELQIEQKMEKLLATILARNAVKRNVPVIQDAEVVIKSDADIESEKRAFRDGIARAFIVRTDEREKQMIHTMVRLFDAQEQRVFKRLETKLSMKTRRKSNVDDIADVTDDDGIFAVPLQDLIRAYIEAEGIQQIQNIDPAAIFQMQANRVKKYLKSEGLKFITSVNQTTTDAIRSAIEDGLDAGEGIPQIKARISAVFDEATSARATAIARTEVLRSSNFATEEAYKQSGVVSGKEWLTASDELVCPFCGPMDGVVVDLNETFFDKGDDVTGTSDKGKPVSLNIGLSNVETPPLHPNCRCTLIPVLKNIDDL